MCSDGEVCDFESYRYIYIYDFFSYHESFNLSQIPQNIYKHDMKNNYIRSNVWFFIFNSQKYMQINVFKNICIIQICEFGKLFMKMNTIPLPYLLEIAENRLVGWLDEDRNPPTIDSLTLYLPTLYFIEYLLLYKWSKLHEYFSASSVWSSLFFIYGVDTHSSHPLFAKYA